MKAGIRKKMRTLKRKRWRGRLMPEDAAGIGKKGAMPEPVSVSPLHKELGDGDGDGCRTSVTILGVLLHPAVFSMLASR